MTGPPMSLGPKLVAVAVRPGTSMKSLAAAVAVAGLSRSGHPISREGAGSWASRP
jgi:hypothetical protein